MARGCFVLRKKLKSHYRLMRVKHPTRKLSRIKHLHLTHIGTRKKKELKAKAGETLDVIPFVTDLMHRYAGTHKPFFFLAAAGRALLLYHAVLKEEPRVLSNAGYQKLMAACTTHLVSYGAGGGVYMPKHHSYTHLSFNARWAGNPSWYSTFTDESENGLVAKQAKRVHPMCFPLAVLRKQLAKERLGL